MDPWFKDPGSTNKQPFGRGLFRLPRVEGVESVRLQSKCGGHVKYVECSGTDRKSTRLNSSHSQISYAVFCLKKKHALAITCQLDQAELAAERDQVQRLDRPRQIAAARIAHNPVSPLPLAHDHEPVLEQCQR